MATVESPAPEAETVSSSSEESSESSEKEEEDSSQKKKKKEEELTPLRKVEALSRAAVSPASRAAFDAAIKTLPNAVDAVRALDLETELLSGTSYASALESIASRAPAAATGPLVGHVLARLRKRPYAGAASMDDAVLSPLAAALCKARKNKEALTAIDAISGDKSPRDYRVGIVAASRLDDANKVKHLLTSALRKQKKRAAEAAQAKRREQLQLHKQAAVAAAAAASSSSNNASASPAPASSSSSSSSAAVGDRLSRAAAAKTKTTDDGADIAGVLDVSFSQRRRRVTEAGTSSSSSASRSRSETTPPGGALGGEDTDPLSTLDESTLRFALKVLARSGDHRTPYSVIDGLPPERRSAALYHAAIAACGKSRPPKGRTAMLLWRKMKRDGFREQIPRATYNALLHCAHASSDDESDSESSSFADAAAANAAARDSSPKQDGSSRRDAAGENATTAILQEMQARGISLNVVSYNVALNSLAARGRFGEMLELLETMEDANIAPTEVTFGTAIHGAARANNSAAAVELLRAHLKYCDVKPADAALGAALESCLRDPDAAQGAASARDVVAIMVDLEVDLDRRDRIEQLAREALHRGTLDQARVDQAETILGLALHNRQVEV